MNEDENDELAQIADEIVDFMKARGMNSPIGKREACRQLLRDFEHLEDVSRRQHQALRKIASAAIDELEEST